MSASSRSEGNRTDRAAGVLLGLACGDALGRPVEFRTPAAIQRDHGRVTEMLADGTHGKPAGTVTDDTDLAVCIARSLVDRGGFHPGTVAERFVAWLDGGPFDVGLMTSEAIDELRHGTPPAEAGRRVWERRPEGSNAGNGSVMRCAPHALAYGDDRGRLVAVSRESSALTHADPRCTWGCAALNLVLAGLVGGVSARETLVDAWGRTAEAPAELRDRLDGVLDADAGTLSASGYVLDTLETGLHHGLTAPTAEEAIVRAVNMGDDADTVGAVTGVVAGARFGASRLPDRWLDTVDGDEELRTLAEDLLALDPD